MKSVQVPVSEQSQKLVTKGQLGYDGMDVRIPFQRGPKRLDDGDHSWLRVGLLDGGSHHLADGLVGERCEIA